jgi:hypothetical protein
MTSVRSKVKNHGRMARGGYRLPKFLSGPDPFTSCGWVTLEMALWLFQGWLAHTADVLRPSSTPLDTPRHTPVKTTALEDEWRKIVLTFRLQVF